MGKLLAGLLSREFIDTDDEIIKLSGGLSVPEIFKLKGEAAFRSLEAQVAEDLSRTASDRVIATGGGMIINPVNYEHLKKDSVIIYLQTKFENIRNRVTQEMESKQLSRPLFKDEIEAKKLYDSRIAIYEKYCGSIINTDNKTPHEIAKEIAEAI